MLPKKRRISKVLFRKGGPSRTKVLSFATVRITPLDGQTRASFIVSKKVAKSAVLRNKLRRRGYSYLSPYLGIPKQGYALFFYIKNEMKSLKKDLITKEIESFMRDLG